MSNNYGKFARMYIKVRKQTSTKPEAVLNLWLTDRFKKLQVFRDQPVVLFELS